jgi:hypothetical protein
MTGFERAAIALIYNLYYGEGIHSSGKQIAGKRYTVETYDDENALKKKRYFKVRLLSKFDIDIELEEDSRHKVYNTGSISKGQATIQTEDRPHEKIEIECLESSYTKGRDGRYEFRITHWSSDQVRIRDDEYNKNYTYRICG